MALTLSDFDNCYIITDSIPDINTASIGLWLQNGARYESLNEQGYAHFLEHLVFKQTKQHSGAQLSTLFEVMGGHINAETGRELTAFHGLVPQQHAIELLSLFIEMLFQSDFNQNDFKIERNVVLQELAMLKDDPEEALEDFGSEQVWRDHNIGRQILGSRSSLNNASFNGMHEYLKTVTRNKKLCIVATGNVDHDSICAACEKIPAPKSSITPNISIPEYFQSSKHLDIPTEQKHLLWVMPAVSYDDELQPVYEIANHIIAGGYDSRLYQVLREQLGLVYSIDSRVDHYSDTGLWFIQTNTEKQNSAKTIEAIENTLLDLINHGPTEQEIEFAQLHLQSSLIIASDDLEASMDKLARDVIYTGKSQALEDQINALKKVSQDDIQSIIKQAWSCTSHFTAG